MARLLVAVSAALLMDGTAFAQIPAAGSPAGINAAFVKLFGAVTTFTARAEARVIDRSQQETVRMPMDWAALDGKVRLEINLEQMTNKDLPPGTVASLKQSGMARIVSLFRPDQKATYVVYPGVQSYQNVPLAPGEVEAAQKGLKLEKSALGKETIEGHACVKNKVVVKGEKGAVLEAITWNAADLKDFPMQIEMKEKQTTVRLRFSQVQFARPDAKQFDLPANYGLMK
ncbi:MAG TPA: hypothetical protein P5205_16920 [Candidatus Paceibacterota bacterium]|nr:hypothetical protein [Verrucomicrobiota bacterium]HSA12046.1 hypothetical protein [Candidatus Paceibacterota bacterium]